MNFKEAKNSGNKVYERHQELLSLEARQKFGDKVTDLIRELPKKVFGATQNGELEVLIHSDPVEDFFTDNSRRNNSGYLSFGTFGDGISPYSPPPKHPLKGTFVQVLHEECRKSGIIFRTYEPKDSGQVETYIHLYDL